MFSFHEAPPPSRPWSAIIREPCASAPVSASSRQSRIARVGLGQDRGRAACASARRLRVVKSSPKSVSPARTSLRVCQPANTGGRGASPSPPASAPRGQPQVGPQRLLAARAAAPRAADVDGDDLGAPPRRPRQRRIAAAAPAAACACQAPSAAQRRRQHPRAGRRQRVRDRTAPRSCAPGRSRTGSRRCRSPAGRAPPPRSARRPTRRTGRARGRPGAVAAAMRAATRSGGLRDQYLCSR